MKKRIGVIMLLLSVFLVIYLICFLGSPVRLAEISVNEEQFQEIMDSRSVSDVRLLDALFFDEQKLIFDASSETFYYSLVEGSKDAYNPYVKKQSEYKTISIAVLNAQITDQDIKDNRIFQLIAYDDTSYCEYRLKCTTLPLMNIECDTEIDAEDVPMHMTLFDNRIGAAQKFTESDGNIHVRGGTTRAYPKKGYKLSLTKTSLAENVRLNKVSLLGMRQDDDWILYAAYNDQEKIRNVFSSKLWKDTCAQDNSLGIDNGMEYQYIELFINHEYWGLYALGYPIDELQLEIDMGKNEHLYKKISWDTEDQILSQPENPVIGYDTKESEDDEWAPLKKYYTTLSTEWENSESMYQGVDIDNAIDMYLFINLIQGLDQVGAVNSLSIKNMFLSVHNKGGKEKVIYTPWDMDITWGNQWNGDEELNLTKPYGIKSSQNTVMGLGNLPALILNGDDEIWNLIFDKYKKLRDNLWSEESINEILDRYEEDIYMSGAYLRDRNRWPNGSYWDADRGLDDFREYVADRLHEADKYYSRLEHVVLGSDACKNVYTIRSMQYKDFLQSDFILILNDKALLSQDDYKEFLEYIGIDTELITDHVNFVVVNGADKKAEYYETLSVPEGVDTCIGHVNIPENESGIISVNDVEWCAIDMSNQNGIDLIFGNEESVSHFDFSREYVMWSNLCEQQDPHVWCEELKNRGYDVVVEIVNHDVIREERFQALLGGFGVNTDDISENTDFIAIQNASGSVTILNNSHASGTRCDTVLGTISVFYNDEGGYGVYMNNQECMAAWPKDNDYVDIRVAVVLSDPYEVIWCPTFSY